MKLTITSLSLLLCGAIALADDAPTPMPVKEPELRSELLSRTKTDQEARNELIQWMNDHGSNGVFDEAKLSKEKQAEYARVLPE